MSIHFDKRLDGVPTMKDSFAPHRKVVGVCMCVCIFLVSLLAKRKETRETPFTSQTRKLSVSRFYVYERLDHFVRVLEIRITFKKSLFSSMMIGIELRSRTSQ